MDHLEEIRSRLSIEELVGSYVQLKKAGRNLRGLCPFHNEKTPSFMVSPEKGIAYCFGCQQGGDVFKFTQLVENVEFGEAMRILADKTGVALPKFSGPTANKRLKTIEINKAAVDFYQEQLEERPKMRDYFKDRGLTPETMQKFHLGYAPDSFHALKDYLANKNFHENELLESGVINQRSLADKNSFDRFRNRLIFPIYDHQDNPIGFGGRIMGDGEPKYLNSSDSPAYNKSMVLYGLNWGKGAIKKEDIAIFVEGYMDVITAHQAGFENVIATSGTALTAQQLKLIKRYTKNIAFAFDSDAAGLEATKRAIELAQLAEVNIKIIVTPTGKDPDECIKNAPDEWKKAVEKPVDVMDFYFNYAHAHFDVTTMEGKKGILGLLLPIIQQYESEMEKGFYLDRLALDLKTDVKLLWEDLKKLKAPRSYGPPQTQTETQTENIKNFTREEYLLGFIFEYPHLYPLLEEHLIPQIAQNLMDERFYKACKVSYNRESGLKLEQVMAELEPEDRQKIDIYRLLIEEHYPDFSEDAVRREIKNLVAAINRKNLKTVQKQYEFRIRETDDPEERTLILNQYNEILKLSAKL